MAKLYQYAVFLEEVRDRDDAVSAPARLIVEPSTVLARDDAQAQLIAARAIPADELTDGALERLVVVVRPF